MTMHDAGIITLAYGLPKYIEMAKSLARSLQIHSPQIPRSIVTDCIDDAEILALFTTVIPLRREYGSNVRQKLYLDMYSPYTNTLFIDSDCLVVRDLQFIFDSLEGISFSVPGENYLTFGSKDPFVDVDRILNHFGITKLPKFNGGLYYIEKNEISTKMFDSARDILSKSSELGFLDFRGDGAADEPVVAVAMMLHNQNMFQDNGTMMRTPFGLKGPFDIDVLTGKSTFLKENKVVSPAVLHFASEWCEHPAYVCETLKLKRLSEGNKNTTNLILFPKFQLRYGYQIALLRFVLKRIIKNPYYLKKVINKLLY
jgi:hypothetical protein